MITHLIPTVEAFTRRAEALAIEHGGVVLHPANRMTSCGRRMSNLRTTTDPGRVTCKTCAKRRAA